MLYLLLKALYITIVSTFSFLGYQNSVAQLHDLIVQLRELNTVGQSHVLL